MSDILEDQKIHFIVKDYRRMFNSYQTLENIIKEQEKSLKEKDKEILILRSKVNELKNEHPEYSPHKGKLKGILNEIEALSNSMNAKLQQGVIQSNKISNDVEELRQLINV